MEDKTTKTITNGLDNIKERLDKLEEDKTINACVTEKDLRVFNKDGTETKLSKDYNFKPELIASKKEAEQAFLFSGKNGKKFISFVDHNREKVESGNVFKAYFDVCSNVFDNEAASYMVRNGVTDYPTVANSTINSIINDKKEKTAKEILELKLGINIAKTVKDYQQEILDNKEDEDSVNKLNNKLKVFQDFTSYLITKIADDITSRLNYNIDLKFNIESK